MLDLLVQFVFNIVNKLISVVMSPLISAITSLFPSTTTIFLYIGYFFDYAFTYIGSVRNWLLIPTSAITTLFAYFIIKYTIQVAIISYKGIANLYEKFKP